MSRKPWQERIVGERMAADERFADRVTDSQFSRQQWGLIMTAVEFEIADADDPERASLVADTGKLRHVMSELDEVGRRMDAMAGGGGRPGSGGGGIVDSLKGALGLGSDDGGTEADQQAAAALAQEYADELQALLEERGRWEEVRTAAADAGE